MELQWPLIIFTLCTCISAGIFCMQALLAYKGKGRELQLPALVTAVVFLGIGGIASFLHLQHWDRMFNGFGHITSGITQELIGIAVIAVMMVIYFVVMRKNNGDVPQWTAIMAIVGSVGLVFVMGHSYLMPARLAWNTYLLPLYYLASAFMLGSLAIWLIASIRKCEDALAFSAKSALISCVAMAVVVLVYTIFIGTLGFSEVGYSFDPTSPTSTLSDPSILSTALVSGQLAVCFWFGVVAAGILAPFALTWFGKKITAASTKLTGFVGAALALAIVGGLCWRCALYILGASIFALY